MNDPTHIIGVGIILVILSLFIGLLRLVGWLLIIGGIAWLIALKLT